MISTKFSVPIAIILCLLVVWLEGLSAAIVNISLINNKDAQVTFSSKACSPGTCPPVGINPIVLIGTIEINSIGLFAFDLSSIPNFANIVSASLQLPTGFSLGAPSPSGITLNVFRLTNTSFNEATVDSQSVPTFITPALGTVTFADPGPSSTLDVTSQTQAGLAASPPSIGFYVTSQSGNVFFNSKEGGGGAKLIISYDDAPVSGGGCPINSCPSTLSCCPQPSGPSCFDPNVYTCFDDLLCPVNHSACGRACYRPSQYTCIDGFLCPVGHLKCGQACYRSEQYNCCNNQLVPKSQSC